MLCFWCGCDEEQIDRSSALSGMMAPNGTAVSWHNVWSNTIRNAIASCQTILSSVNAQDMVDARYEFSSLGHRNGWSDTDKALKKLISKRIFHGSR
jgi:hypothetical protein